jgi:hypothetical protein
MSTPTGSVCQATSAYGSHCRAPPSNESVIRSQPLHYADALSAGTDLAARERVLHTRESVRISAPYSRLLILDAGRIEGSNLILDISHQPTTRAGQSLGVLRSGWLGNRKP